jgi:gliding motility-associated-like protein
MCNNNRICFLLFFLSMAFSGHSMANGIIERADSLALLTLYWQTDGPNWTKKWDLKASPRTWYGIQIDTVQKKVVRIDLRNNNLRGFLPNELGSMSLLSTLLLSNNQLSGTIPSNLGNATNLQYLDLSNNQLNGTIPFSLSNLSLIRDLRLNNNQLSGTLFDNWEALSGLQTLNLSNNQFIGRLPESLGRLLNLNVLNLSNNQFEGNFPAIFYNLRQLSELNLSKNAISGELYANISNWRNLRLLNLSQNKFSGEIPQAIGDLRLLEDLNLSYNGFFLLLPNDFGKLDNLVRIDLSHNSLTGPMFGIGNFAKAQYINLSFNRFQSSLFPLQLLTNLQQLDLSHNQIDGSIFGAKFEYLQNIKYIDLSYNQIQSILPENIGFLSNLVYLNLAQNNFMGVVPSQIGQLRNLQKLYLYKNFFTGDLPPQIDSLKNLKILSLHHNRFDNLPVFRKAKLDSLDAASNRLTYEDFEENLNKVGSLVYAPQDTVFIRTNCYLDTKIGGQRNVYQWFRNDKPIPNATKAVYTVLESGVYFVEISNPLFPLLRFRTPAILTAETVPVIDLGDNQEYGCGKFEAILNPRPQQNIPLSPDIKKFADAYRWSTGDTTALLRVSRGGVYRVAVRRGSCVATDSIRIIYRGISDNKITDSQDICTESQPTPLNGTLSAINITPKFLWQKSNDKKVWYNVGTEENYSPPFLASEAYFRRIVSTDLCGHDTSNLVLIRLSNIQLNAQKTDIRCAGEKNGRIELNVTNGLPPYKIEWQNARSESLLANLTAGTYSVKVRDRIGCERNETFVISEPNPLKMNPIVVQASCSDPNDGGSIVLNLAGGTLPYSIRWSNGAMTEKITNLAASTSPYSVQITDKNGCTLNYSVKIERSRANDSRFKYPFSEYCREENDPLPQIIGGKGGKFSAKPEGLVIQDFTGAIDLKKSQAGDYWVEYKLNECSITAFEIKIKGACQAEMPNTITPNGDSVNDTWELPLLSRYPQSKVVIFNRWGNVLFESAAGYPQAWDGKLQGEELPEGTYYHITDLRNGSLPIKGFITLIR